jgi:hypothetical protein
MIPKTSANAATPANPGMHIRMDNRVAVMTLIDFLL